MIIVSLLMSMVRNMIISDFDILNSLKEDRNKGTDLLFDRYYRPLVIFADSIINDLVYSEDIVQEAFYRFLKDSVYKTLNENALSTYLFMAVKNLCFNKVNRKKVIIPELEILKFDSIEEEFKTFDPILIDEIVKEIENLPEKTRHVVKEIVLHGKKYKEVAENSNVSVNTIKSLLSNGLNHLRKLFPSERLILFYFYIKNSNSSSTHF